MKYCLEYTDKNKNIIFGPFYPFDRARKKADKLIDKQLKLQSWCFREGENIYDKSNKKWVASYTVRSLL